MKRQTTEEIIEFLKKNVEPLSDKASGTAYRASVYLTDNTYLPCVIFRNPNTVIELAIRRFNEEQKGKGVFSKGPVPGYRDIVKTFVNRLSKESLFCFITELMRNHRHGEIIVIKFNIGIPDVGYKTLTR